MKKYLLFIPVLMLALTSLLNGNGIVVVDASIKKVLKLNGVSIFTNVNGQVAETMVLSTFENQFTAPVNGKYAFPLSQSGSATKLRWRVNQGTWNTAVFSPTPQDTTLPGGGGNINIDLKNYLGNTPVYFEIPDTLQPEDMLEVEFTYVELLHYEFGIVNYFFPLNYTLIQNQQVSALNFNFSLASQREIISLQCTSHPEAQITNTGNTGTVLLAGENIILNKNIAISYSLSLQQLGLSGYSTFLQDSASIADSINGGYFLFVVEPEIDSSQILPKKFTFIIDRSGSMYGYKMQQAKSAAQFIVERLNPGDYFNIVDFAGDIRSFRTTLVEATQQNINSASQYINGLTASGLTNISGAFSTAIPQFFGSNDSTANIIIFMTDGQATSGITATNSLVTHINNLISGVNANLSLFNFGVGTDVNVQVLSQTANANGGFASFVGSENLEESITKFYLKVQNPVIINTVAQFTSNGIYEVYPGNLPNVYLGQQLLIAGRYDQGTISSVVLTGNRYGLPVSYEFELPLNDTTVTDYQFLTKVWAKSKIEDLTAYYYTLNPNSPQAIELKQEIIRISLRYGVLTVFTSFSGGDPTGIEEEIENSINTPSEYTLSQNFPNPFSGSLSGVENQTTISFTLPERDYIVIRVYDITGRMIAIIFEGELEAGTYNIKWKPGEIASGIYVYEMSTSKVRLSKKMMVVK
ncbi:MAG: VWA domain-containing protein [Ignavibacteriaceae bacterium]|nr:VWA domain-containing protein [Ignavibacteriaceae bacterium]